VCTDLVQADDLTVGLLDLPQAGEEVPETALSNNRVGRKNAHTVELGSGLGVSGQMTPNDLVFLQATCWATESALSDGQNVRRHMFVLQLRDHHDSVERMQDAWNAPVQVLLEIFLLFQPIAKSRCRSALAADPVWRECLPICAEG
jgi:hypothetical protein